MYKNKGFFFNVVVTLRNKTFVFCVLSVSIILSPFSLSFAQKQTLGAVASLSPCL